MRYKNFKAIHLFQCRILTVFGFYFGLTFTNLKKMDAVVCADPVGN